MPPEWFRERLPARNDSASAPELVLLHGWAASAEIWRPGLPRLRELYNVTLIELPGHGRSAFQALSADQAIEALAELLPPRAIVLGWSLGGMLATRLAARYPEKVTALITVATNGRFVAQHDWPQAMASEQFEAFFQGLESAPDKTLRRFQALQAKGDSGEKALLKQLRAVNNLCHDSLGLQQGLDWLRELNNRAPLRDLACPALHLYGERDALVPPAAAEAVQELSTGAQVATLTGAAHLPFLSQPEVFWPRVVNFLAEHGLSTAPAHHDIDKQQVARSFSRAAGTYDGVAELQRRVADALLEVLPSAKPGRWVDLGCGTGYSLPALRARNNGELLALDLAEGMLRYARSQPERRADGWLCSDAENLPLADDSVDGFFSSLSLQWCENLGAVFAEAYRALRPGGWLLMSTLGPDTLFELRAAGRAADDYTHVNRFAERDAVQAAIDHSGLKLEGWQQRDEVLHYRELRELMSELKQLGAHNLNAGRPGGLTGRARLRRFIEGYEQFRDPQGRLPASYQVWMLRLRKPHA